MFGNGLSSSPSNAGPPHDRGRSPDVTVLGCPNLADQKQLLALLGAEEIGITLSEEDQLDPEQSTYAIMVRHPPGKYFSV